MELLHFLVFLLVWGLMWRWVVKNRGSWNLFVGTVAGILAGFIVALVVMSITLSLFPPAPRPGVAQMQNGETDIASSAIRSELQNVARLTPVIASTPDASDMLVSYVADAPQNEPAPPESALLPNYRTRLPASLLEKDFKDIMGNDFVVSRRLAGSSPNADRSLMAFMMCEPFIKRAMRFSASTTIADVKGASSHRFKDQTYTISSTVTARNMLGDDVSYGYDCSVQQIDGNDTDKAAWRLLDLKLQKVAS
jgi:hypothetical protein